MATFQITDPNTGRTIELTGDSPPTEQELEQIFATLSTTQIPQQPTAQQSGFAGLAREKFGIAPDLPPPQVPLGIIEPAAAVASSLATTIGGGLAGGFQALNPFADEGAGARTLEAAQGLSFQPKSEEGIQGLKTLGDLAQKGIDIANFPISGLAGLVELVSGQGFDQAGSTVRAVQDVGAGKAAGSRILEATGSPLAATAAETLISGAGDIAGLKGIGAVGRGSAAVAEAPRAVVEGATSLFKKQSPTKQRIAKLIQEGSTDIETARLKLTPGSGRKQTAVEKFLNTGGPRVQKDKVAVETIRQGFDEGVIAAVKGSNPTDKTKMLRMVDIMERGKANKKFAVTNRPSDVAGDTLMERFRAVRTANKKAGRQLEGVAQDLKGKAVDHTPAINEFIDDLGSIGVTIGDDLKPQFRGSDVEGLAGPEQAIKRIVNRLAGTKPPDAFELHRMKRFIDEQVSFGKSAEGLTGRTENILKNLRRNLDGILDSNFPEYDRVNTVFSETIGAIDAFQDVAGRKMDLTAANANKATGTLMRRIMSNAQSRIRLLDAVDQIESVANKHGIRFDDAKRTQKLIEQPGGRSPLFDDDLLTQILFVDELDSVFGPVARTSFQGQIDQAIRQGASADVTGLAIGAAVKGAQKLRGVNEAGAFRSIKDLLRGK